MASVEARPMYTDPVDRATAAAIEAAEAWADLYAAAPPGWATEAGLGSLMVDGALVLHWRASGRRYFSRTIGLGVSAPATGGSIELSLEIWRELDIEMFLLQSLPHCLPEGSRISCGRAGSSPSTPRTASSAAPSRWQISDDRTLTSRSKKWE